MLYGYGGFSISVLPVYRSDVPAWLELGGVFVSVNMRGGAEYGESWHKAGYLEQQAERVRRLHRRRRAPGQGATTPRPIVSASMGGSNGGLLVGAVMEQRPDLFAVALPAVGVMDMLRYDRFTGGKLWATEYGSSSDPRQFAFLIKYSPLHNVRAGHVLSGDARHDRRSRRSRRAEPLLQVHGGAAGRAGLRAAGAHSRGDSGLARVSADGSADCGEGGSVGVCRRASGRRAVALVFSKDSATLAGQRLVDLPSFPSGHHHDHCLPVSANRCRNEDSGRDGGWHARPGPGLGARRAP